MPGKKTRTSIALGEAIRSIRTGQGLTQEEFALKAGIDRSYYGAIERGEFNVTMDTLMKIARTLAVPASEIMERAGL
jgi:transcriptional regulator with XRE-family HTH domain